MGNYNPGAYAIHVRNPTLHAFFLAVKTLLIKILFRHAQANVFKYPEKWFPRRFEIFGASHQILHVMAVLARLAHTLTVLQAFDFLHKHGNTCIRQSS